MYFYDNIFKWRDGRKIKIRQDELTFNMRTYHCIMSYIVIEVLKN